MRDADHLKGHAEDREARMKETQDRVVNFKDTGDA